MLFVCIVELILFGLHIEQNWENVDKVFKNIIEKWCNWIKEDPKMELQNAIRAKLSAY